MTINLWSQSTLSFAMYICRACGAEIAYPQRFIRCPVCGIKWG